MLENTKSPARAQALAKTSAETLIPLPWAQPMSHESLFLTKISSRHEGPCSLKSPNLKRPNLESHCY